MIPTTTEVFAGAAYVLLGDPTTALGAGMIELGLLPDVRVRLALSKQGGQNEKGQVMADSMFTRGLKGVEVQLTMYDSSAAIMAAFVTETIVGANSLGFSTEYARVDPLTMAIIPAVAKGQPLTDQRKMWITAVDNDQLSEFAYTMAEGRETTNPYTVTFYGGVRYTDQADDAIADGYRMFFRGTPADAGVTWTLPTGY